MTVADIVRKYLTDNGYDGLCTDGCGCSLDEFMPCCSDGVPDCVPAYRVSEERARELGYYIMESCDFVMVETKECE